MTPEIISSERDAHQPTPEDQAVLQHEREQTYRRVLAEGLLAQSSDPYILFSASSQDRQSARVVYCTADCVAVFKRDIMSGEPVPFLTDNRVSEQEWARAIRQMSCKLPVEIPFHSPRRPHGAPGVVSMTLLEPEKTPDSERLYSARLVETPSMQSSKTELADVLSGSKCLLWEADVLGRDSQFHWQINWLNLEEALQWFGIDAQPEIPAIDVWVGSMLPESLEQKHQIGKRALTRGLDAYRSNFFIRSAAGEVRQVTESVRVNQIAPDHWHLIGSCVDSTEAMFTSGELKDIVSSARCLTWKASVTLIGARLNWELAIAHEDLVRQWLPLSGTPGFSLSAKWAEARVPEDRKRCEARLLTALQSHDSRVDQEFRVLLDDGSTRWMSETVQIAWTSPTKCRLVGICVDITERKNVEIELRRAIEGARCMVWHAKVTDSGHRLDWDIRMVNEDVGERLWPIDNPRGTTYSVAWAEARHPVDEAIIDKYATDAIRSGNKEYRQEFRTFLADGKIAWFSEDVRIDRVGEGIYDLVGVLTDVTERKNAEQALSEERNMLRTLFDGLPHSVYVKDINHRYITVNDAFYVNLGIPLDFPIAGKRDEDFVDPKFAAYVEADEKRVMSTGEPMVDREDYFTLANGSPLWVSTTKVPMRDAEGNISGLVGVSRDVTSYKSAIQELEQTMTSARCIVWNAIVTQADGYFDWEFHLTNEEAGRRLWPLPEQNYDCYSSAWVFAKLIEDQRVVDNNIRDAMLSGETSLKQQFRLRVLDGSIRWLAEDIQIEKLSNGKWRMVGVCTDITQQKENELDLRDAMTRARCLVWHSPVHRDGQYFTWRLQIPNAETIQKWLPLELPENRTYEECWTGAVIPEDQINCDKMAHDALTNGKDKYTQEYRLKLSDGKIRWIVEYVQIERKDADDWYLVGVCTDNTEKKLLEIERERMLNAAIERADTDSLTGLLNHRAFHARLKVESEKAIENGTSLGVVMIDLDNFKFFNDAYGHLAGDDVLREVSHALSSRYREDDTIARFGGDEFALLIPGLSDDDPKRIAARVREELSGLSFSPPSSDTAIPLSLSVGFAVFPEEGASRYDVLDLADKRLMLSKIGSDSESDPVERLVDEMISTVQGFSMLNALVTAVDNKDRYTRRHSEDVLNYCVDICNELQLDEEMCHQIRVAALLHDVGKIGVPDSVLRKPGRLTEDEFTAVKQHPEMGAVIVGAVPELCYTLDAVRHHHERWDGNGYPNQLAGEAIPLSARVMAVADAYSAMTTDRPYRKSMSDDAAQCVLSQGSATQWDPECVAAFLRSRKHRNFNQAA